MKQIPLTRGFVATVDDCDYELVSRFSWHTVSDKGGRNYAYTAIRIWGSFPAKHRHLSMHCMVLGLRPDRIRDIDHKDHDGLNNCRSNLRAGSRMENMRNRRKQSSSSRFKGVYLHHFKNFGKVTSSRWRAQIQVDGKKMFLGFFDLEEDAGRAYDEAARKYFGEFAHCNF
jgi:hypothetical protein